MRRFALVIGAGPGLGAATAAALVAAGHDVGLIARSGEKLAELAAELADGAAAITTASADVAAPDDLNAAVTELARSSGRVDVLHFNPSKFRSAAPSELTAEALLNDLAVGAAPLLTAVRSALPYMSEGSTVLVTGSGAADRPMKSAASLGVQKAAVRNLTQVLALELADRGIHVATITIKGTIAEDTPFAPALIARAFMELVEETRLPREQWRTVVEYTGS
jgi:NAD(P)-dependent dehydrogenase (short-subunit alcohol dehydrogenase family)